MQRGCIKFWSDRGFGFITPDNGGPDVFVHARQAKAAGYAGLCVGQVLRFEVRMSRRTGKLEAVDLELIEPITSPRAEAQAPRHQRERDDDDDMRKLATMFAPRR